jgi:hypothetical protein
MAAQTANIGAIRRIRAIITASYGANRLFAPKQW